MKTYKSLRQLARAKWVFLTFLVILFTAACGSTQDQDDTAPTIEVRINTPVADAAENSADGEAGTSVPEETTNETNDGLESAYPAPVTEPPPDQDAGYAGPIPTPEGAMTQPPDPERNLPEAADDSGVVGGVLIRELVEGGFLPVSPKALFLADVVSTDNGTPAFIRQNSESPQADILNAGVFIFNFVPPGEYGLVVDIGIAQLPVTDADGEQLIFTVKAGEAFDIGQVFVPPLGSQ